METEGTILNQGQTETTTTAETPEGSSKSWKDSLPDDIRTDPSLMHINEIEALAKSYVHAQRKIGADKITVPGKEASEEDWTGVFRKLGVPESLEEYKIDVEYEDKEFVAKFKEAAHKMNLLPKQAEGLLKAYVGMQNEQKQAQEEEKLAKIKELEKDLQTEWGIAYKANLNRAFVAAKEFGGDEFVAHLENSGLGNDIEVIKFLNKVGEQLKEDTAPQGGEQGGGALSPDQARQKIDEIMGDMKGPYWDSTNPAHDRTVKQVYELQKMAALTA